MKRVWILVLACLMLVPALAACRKSPGGNPSSTSGTPTTEAPTTDTGSETDEPEDYYKPTQDLTKLDYDDVKVRILQCEYKRDEFDFNFGSSETMSNAVFSRNKQVEEDLGIRFEYISVASDPRSPEKLSSEVRENRDLDENDKFHIVAQPSYYSVSLILEGLYQNLASVENSYIDLSRKYWSQGFMEASTVNDRYYFLVGELCTSVLDEMEVVFVNKSLAADYFGDTDLQELVYNKEWTYEKMLELIDTAGSGESSGTWGLIATPNSLSIDGMLGSMGLTTVSIGDNGLPQSSINNATNIGIVEKLRDLYWNNASVSNTGDAVKRFSEGESIFTMSMLVNAANLYKSGIQYTLIPMPMYGENQGDYVVTAHDEYTSLSVCAGLVDMSRYTAVLEDLCYRSHETTYAAKYEKTYGSRYAQSPENRRMFDFMYQHLNFDLGAIYSYVLGECKNVPRYLLYPYDVNMKDVGTLSRNASITTIFINLENQVNNGLEKFIEFFYADEN